MICVVLYMGIKINTNDTVRFYQSTAKFIFKSRSRITKYQSINILHSCFVLLSHQCVNTACIFNVFSARTAATPTFIHKYLSPSAGLSNVSSVLGQFLAKIR